MEVRVCKNICVCVCVQECECVCISTNVSIGIFICVFYLYVTDTSHYVCVRAWVCVCISISMHVCVLVRAHVYNLSMCICLFSLFFETGVAGVVWDPLHFSQVIYPASLRLAIQWRPLVAWSAILSPVRHGYWVLLNSHCFGQTKHVDLLTRQNESLIPNKDIVFQNSV